MDYTEADRIIKDYDYNERIRLQFRDLYKCYVDNQVVSKQDVKGFLNLMFKSVAKDAEIPIDFIFSEPGIIVFSLLFKNERFYSTEEIAKIQGCSKANISRARSFGHLKGAIKVGTGMLHPELEVIKYFKYLKKDYLIEELYKLKK